MQHKQTLEGLNTLARGDLYIHLAEMLFPRQNFIHNKEFLSIRPFEAAVVYHKKVTVNCVEPFLVLETLCIKKLLQNQNQLINLSGSKKSLVLILLLDLPAKKCFKDSTLS